MTVHQIFWGWGSGLFGDRSVWPPAHTHA